MELNRRRILTVAAPLIMSPAIVKAEHIMPVSSGYTYFVEQKIVELEAQKWFPFDIRLQLIKIPTRKIRHDFQNNILFDDKDAIILISECDKERAAKLSYKRQKRFSEKLTIETVLLCDSHDLHNAIGDRVPIWEVL